MVRFWVITNPCRSNNKGTGVTGVPKNIILKTTVTILTALNGRQSGFKARHVTRICYESCKSGTCRQTIFAVLFLVAIASWKSVHVSSLVVRSGTATESILRLDATLTLSCCSLQETRLGNCNFKRDWPLISSPHVVYNCRNSSTATRGI